MAEEGTDVEKEEEPALAGDEAARDDDVSADEDEPPEQRVEDVDPESEDEELEFVYSITSYGADYPVDGLVRRVESGDIAVPEFQRKFIWPRPRIERFIESLLLGLPVPGIFLAREEESNRLLVIDGQQRLRTLAAFYKGVLRGKEFRLSKGVQSQFVDRTYETLEPEDRRRLDDSIIHATVIKQDVPSDDQSSVYFIFERLNTGGTLLQPQEIRAAIYPGRFSELLHKINDLQAWRDVFGPPSPRLKDQELILRFFAFGHNATNYKRPMKEFLNEFMGTHRRLRLLNADSLECEFAAAIAALTQQGALEPRRLFRPGSQINAAVFDAVMVGIAKRLEADAEPPEGAAVRGAYEALLANEEFQRAYGRATADEASVESRLKLATEAFTALP